MADTISTDVIQSERNTDVYTAPKIIVGVEHKDRSEIEVVIRSVEKYYPLSSNHNTPTLRVGLELPDDYHRRQELSITSFFIELSTYFATHQTTIIPLDDAKLSDYIRGYFKAREIVEGKITRKEVEQELERELNDFYKNCSFRSPEQNIPQIYLIQTCQNALDITKEKQTLEQVLEEWAQINLKREQHMVAQIQKKNPLLIIVGFHHADYIRQQFPQYQYIRTFG